MKLDKEIKEKWITALRSRKYEQGKEYLAVVNDDDFLPETQFCCLGVLGIVCGLSLEDLTGDQLFDEMFDKEKILKIPELLRGSTDGENKNDLITTLTHMNDGGGQWNDNPQTFEQIANYIDKNL